MYVSRPAICHYIIIKSIDFNMPQQSAENEGVSSIELKRGVYRLEETCFLR